MKKCWDWFVGLLRKKQAFEANQLIQPILVEVQNVPLIKLVFLGADNVGKTLCLQRLNGQGVTNGNRYINPGTTMSNPPPVECAYNYYQQKWNLKLIDNQGVGNFNSVFCKQNIPNDSYYMLLFTLDERFQSSFKKAMTHLQILKNQYNIPNKKIIFVGNKMDIATQYAVQTQIRIKCQQLNIQYIEIETQLIDFCVNCLLKRRIIQGKQIEYPNQDLSDNVICFLGPKGGGKTTIFKRLLGQNNQLARATVRDNRERIRQNPNYQLIDTVGVTQDSTYGQDWIRLYNKYVNRTRRPNLFVIVFDCSSTPSHQLADQFYNLLIESNISKRQILIIANKCQRQQYKAKSRNLKKLWRQRNVQYLETHIKEQHAKNKINTAIKNCLIHHSYYNQEI